MPQSVITTRRLVLRLPVLADAEAIFASYGQDPEVTRYLIWQPHTSLEDTRTFVRGCIAAWDEGVRFPWVILRASDGQLLGMLDARIDDGFKVSVGYVLAREHWGNGYVPEALQAVIDLFWRRPDVFRIWAICDVENPASARVLEKVGMTREGTLRRYVRHPNVSDEPRDAYCYAITR
jgi:ribosomal-protein-alanine N-acetyltransferase